MKIFFYYLVKQEFSVAGVRKMFFGCAQSTVDFFPLGTSEVFTDCSGLVDHIRLSLDQSRSVSSQLLFVYDDDIRLFEQLSVCLSVYVRR